VSNEKNEKMQSPSLHVLAAKKLKECKSLKRCLFVYLSVCSLLRLFVCQFSSLMAQISTGNNWCWALKKLHEGIWIFTRNLIAVNKILIFFISQMLYYSMSHLYLFLRSCFFKNTILLNRYFWILICWIKLVNWRFHF
jgi:hypothetical protein